MKLIFYELTLLNNDMIMHKIWNIHVHIYTITWRIISWSIGWMVKELVCGRGDEGSISSKLSPKWL
jgi:hypothetical protein